MKRNPLHLLSIGVACLTSVATCLVGCGGGNTGGGVGEGGVTNVNYKFSSNSVNCGKTLVISKNVGLFPASETVSFQGISGSVAGTVSLSTDKTQLTVSFPNTAFSGKYNVQLADDGRIGTMAYTGCSTN